VKKVKKTTKILLLCITKDRHFQVRLKFAFRIRP